MLLYSIKILEGNASLAFTAIDDSSQLFAKKDGMSYNAS
jgi:hypothetical protein